MFADRIEIITADITTLAVDAIVNAANTSYWAGAAWMARSIARLVKNSTLSA